VVSSHATRSSVVQAVATLLKIQATLRIYKYRASHRAMILSNVILASASRVLSFRSCHRIPSVPHPTRQTPTSRGERQRRKPRCVSRPSRRPRRMGVARRMLLRSRSARLLPPLRQSFCRRRPPASMSRARPLPRWSYPGLFLPSMRLGASRGLSVDLRKERHRFRLLSGVSPPPPPPPPPPPLSLALLPAPRSHEVGRTHLHATEAAPGARKLSGCSRRSGRCSDRRWLCFLCAVSFVVALAGKSTCPRFPRCFSVCAHEMVRLIALTFFITHLVSFRLDKRSRDACKFHKGVAWFDAPRRGIGRYIARLGAGRQRFR